MTELERLLLELIRNINQGDEAAQAEATQYLDKISDRSLVPALVRLLSDERPGEGVSHYGQGTGLRLSDPAIVLLRRFGEGGLVEAFDQTMEGKKEGIEALKRSAFRAEIIEALISALDSKFNALVEQIKKEELRARAEEWDGRRFLDGGSGSAANASGSVVNVANALAELGAVEALAKLRSKLGFPWMVATDPNYTAARQAIAKAVTKLENLETLPRPADDVVTISKNLPRVPSETFTDTDTLPRGSDHEGK